ncbi:MAG: beta-phosphoglucomutase [Saprospiraceae bacterium]|jgi:beta-phosphoglucomutase|tara:strand:+ start:1109 stop:1789 length:681 start_codon:yes stop_codon:yes gene_type:complete
MNKIKGYIFDLDGVIVDTAKYHYASWRRLANKLGFDITEEQNENLKGVSRKESLEYILSIGGVSIPEKEMIKLTELKNSWYVESISGMDDSELLPGALNLLKDIKAKNLGLALGSASKNSVRILKSTGIYHMFDAIIDGTKTTESKPHPQVFLMGAEALKLKPQDCVVFEDSINGVKAANTGGFISIGVGSAEILNHAHFVLPDLDKCTIAKIEKCISNLKKTITL